MLKYRKTGKGGKCMKKLKNYLLGQHALKGMALMALAVTTISQNSACYFITHQDKVPEAARKLRKF